MKVQIEHYILYEYNMDRSPQTSYQLGPFMDPVHIWFRRI